VDPRTAVPAMKRRNPPSRPQAKRGTGYPVKSTRPAPQGPERSTREAHDEGRIAPDHTKGRGGETAP